MHSSIPPVTTWNLDPVLLLALAVLLGGYLYAIGPLNRRIAPDEPAPRSRVASFSGGWLILALSLISPLDTLGRYYGFAAHSFQLFLIITAVAPLLLIGLPEWLVWKLLPLRALRDATRGFGFMAMSVVLFNGLILIWHAGPIFEAGLRNEALHNLESLCFLLAGLLTWWPLLTPLDRHTRLASPFQILYLVVESLPLDIFGAFTLFADHVFYTSYNTAPHLFGFSTVVDQAVGGAIIAVPGNLVDIVIMSLVFFGWIQRVEQAQREHEAQIYGDGTDANAPSEGVQVKPVSNVHDI
ncbi:MAG TPA: cytochrome c oxidase assembly protein [Ktedonobacterales bacterium]|nr:cytochrome c oxidase assembly protein [Ktedonobacterales bacterium]